MTYPTRQRSPRRRHGGRRELAQLDPLLLLVGERRGLLLPTTPAAVARAERAEARPSYAPPSWVGDPEFFRQLLRDRLVAEPREEDPG